MNRRMAVASIAHAQAGRHVCGPAGVATFLEEATEGKVTLSV